jgi:hypothetical protein
MYKLINQFSKQVVDNIGSQYVEDYNLLIQHTGQANEDDYQTRYRRFWAMNRPVSNPAFYTAYFEALNAPADIVGTLEQLILALYAIPTHRDRNQSLQFSFATKLMHMRDIHRPVYDSQVSAFYFFIKPSLNAALQERINGYVHFYNFLTNEYARILRNSLLAASIDEFRRHYDPKYFTDEKIIDSLIWSFVGLRKRDAAFNYQIAYS